MTKIYAGIAFEFDSDVINADREEPMSEEELLAYATECFVDDIYSMVKYGELYDAVRITTEKGN